MRALIDVTPKVLQDPKGVDVPITLIQEELTAQLPWLSHSFGQSKIGNRTNGDGDNEVLPLIYDRGREWISLRAGDQTVKAYSFFYRNGTETGTDDSGLYRNAPIALCFFCNLRKIDKNQDAIFTEELKEEIDRVIYGATSGKIKELIRPETINVDANYLDAFSDFSQVDSQKYFNENYAAFRYTFNIVYQIRCNG